MIERPTEEPRRLSHRPRDDEEDGNRCKGCDCEIGEGREYCDWCSPEEDE